MPPVTTNFVAILDPLCLLATLYCISSHVPIIDSDESRSVPVHHINALRTRTPKDQEILGQRLEKREKARACGLQWRFKKAATMFKVQLLYQNGCIHLLFPFSFKVRRNDHTLQNRIICNRQYKLMIITHYTFIYKLVTTLL